MNVMIQRHGCERAELCVKRVQSMFRLSCTSIARCTSAPGAVPGGGLNQSCAWHAVVQHSSSHCQHDMTDKHIPLELVGPIAVQACWLDLVRRLALAMALPHGIGRSRAWQHWISLIGRFSANSDSCLQCISCTEMRVLEPSSTFMSLCFDIRSPSHRAWLCGDSYLRSALLCVSSCFLTFVSRFMHQG